LTLVGRSDTNVEMRAPMARSLGRWFGPSLGRSFGRSLGRSRARSLGRWLVWATIACTGVAVAGPADDARAKYKAAAKLDEADEPEKALAVIEEGLAGAPKDLELLRLKGRVLLKQSDYVGALAAYTAYIEAGARGANRREAQKIIDMLQAVKSTSLEFTVVARAGAADIYLDSRTRGKLCTAAPSCTRPMLPGEYKVIAEQPGFERWTERVTIAAGKVNKVAVTLVEKPSLLTVRVAQADAHIAVDGSEYKAPMQIAAGSHRVAVSLPGHTDVQREITGRLGQPIDLDITLAPLPPPAPVRNPQTAARDTTSSSSPSLFTGRRKLAVAVGGVSVASAVAGAIFGLQSRSLDDDAFRTCPSVSAPCAASEEATDLNARARSRATLANVAFGVAGGAAVAAAVLWLTGAPESRVTIGPSTSALAGIDVVLRF
jgi:PEGA domain